MPEIRDRIRMLIIMLIIPIMGRMVLIPIPAITKSEAKRTTRANKNCATRARTSRRRSAEKLL
jgi:competence protein ComGC